MNEDEINENIRKNLLANAKAKRMKQCEKCGFGYTNARALHRHKCEPRPTREPSEPPEGKHSPLPWDTDFSGGHADHIYQGTCLVAVVKETQDATLIVRAVNLHSKLVAALEMFHTFKPEDAGRNYCDICDLLSEAKKGGMR